MSSAFKKWRVGEGHDLGKYTETSSFTEKREMLFAEL
jgi:hypothetical protein